VGTVIFPSVPLFRGVLSEPLYYKSVKKGCGKIMDNTVVPAAGLFKPTAD